MNNFRIIQHAPGAPGLRLIGSGPHLIPRKGLLKLKLLFDKHAFWAAGRDFRTLRQILANSTVVISLWRGKRMVGFGRATSDGISRAVLWDVVVAGDLQGKGLGRKVVEALLNSPAVKNVELIYLMTTNGSEFYEQLGFIPPTKQRMLVIRKPNKKQSRDTSEVPAN